MKISELQELLTKAKAKYGDLPVEVVSGASLVRNFYGEVNTARIIRFGESNEIDVGEDLSECRDTILRLYSFLEEIEEEEDN